MKFIVSSSELLKQLTTVSGVIASNPLVPILENFLFQLDKENLTITASDMQTVMITEAQVESEDKVSVAIPAKLLTETLRSLPEQPITVNIAEESFEVEIVTSNGRFKIAGENPLDFPKAAEVNKSFSIELESDILATAIGNTIFATSTDDLRPAMTGVYVQVEEDRTTFVSTDGHRLVRYRRTDVKADQSTSLILPRKALTLLKSSLPSDNMPVKAEFSATNAFFSFGNIRMICRIIDERYPDYENVIPKENPNVIKIERTKLLSTLKRISIYSNKTTHQIRLKVGDDLLEISAEDLDYSNEATEKNPCEYTGTPMEIGFNAKFLVEVLSNLSNDAISLEMSQPNRAGIIIPQGQEENEDMLMLVMPVMLSSYS